MDYSDIGLTRNLFGTNSLPISRGREDEIDNIRFDARYQLQANRLNVSKINIENFIKVSTVASGTADFSAGAALGITSQLEYKTPQIAANIMANSYVGIFQGDGTSSSNEIYPSRGANVTLGRYDVQADYQLNGWDQKKSRWGALLVDTNGTSTQVITAAVQWQYIDYKTDTGASEI